MSTFNIVFLIPGYLQADSPTEHDAGNALHQNAVPMQWQHELRQLPWQLQLCRLAGLDTVEGDHLPVARLLAPSGASDAPAVCADPIHLQADRDTATLLPPAMLALSEQEADALLASLNAFVAEDGWWFSRDSAGLWFMHGMEGAALASYPPTFLAHRNASSFLPDGVDSHVWRRLMAELQMLLHTHPVNQLREQRGQLTVNSLWFWGGADLPDTADTRKARVSGSNASEASITEPQVVFTDDPFAIALCKHGNIPRQSLQDFDPALTMNAVVIDTRLTDAAFANDEQGMRIARQSVDHDWLVPACDRVSADPHGKVMLMNEDGDCGICDANTLLPPAKTQTWWGKWFKRLSGSDRQQRRMVGSTSH